VLRIMILESRFRSERQREGSGGGIGRHFVLSQTSIIEAAFLGEADEDT
jgi:hypothetical protein